MQLSTGYEQRRARIEIVPLIDVVFLLLVFFIYAVLSMTVYRGIRVHLPRAGGRPATGEQFTITLAADNVLSVDGETVSVGGAIEQALARGLAADTPILVNGDRGAELGVAVELLSRLKSNGFRAVSFSVEPAEE